MAIEISNVHVIGEEVHFIATKNDHDYRFAVVKEPLEDLAHYHHDDAAEPLDRLAVFEDFEDCIAREAERFIDAGVSVQDLHRLTSTELCK
ncbi:MAG TPA: hypothetical protein VFS17_06830 [Methylophilaceae bacterium]|nr:hypothetical protein [Methylophilaceae bacterium]